MRKKKTALITGGTSGIGLATAKILAGKDFSVALMGRCDVRGQRAIGELSSSDVIFIKGDVTKRDDCQNAVAKCVQAFGALDVLINSAGIYTEHSLAATDDEEFWRLMAVNMGGTFNMCRAAREYLQKRGGAIINVASDAGLRGNCNCAAYAASKGAVIAFTRSLAIELAAFNVRVNAVAPGDILTPMTKAQLDSDPLGREEALRLMAGVYPLGRIGTPEEAAAVIAFLAGEGAAFVTGAVWSVDGGLTA